MDEDDQAGKSAKGRARQTVSDKRQLSGPSAKRKKANMNIRTAILYRKNFATLIEESVCSPLAIQASCS
jgi:zinc finger HIT domain-containing protein 1